MSQKTSIDENLEEVLVHSWLAEAHRHDEGEARSANFADDEQALIPELAKAFEIERDEVAFYYASYEGLQTGQDAGMQAARRGERMLEDKRANTQYYKATALTHLVNLMVAKDELLDELGEIGQEYAKAQGLMATDEQLAKRIGAISLVEKADIGTIFGWPSDDRTYTGTTPQATYLSHFVAFQDVVDADIAMGVLDLSVESPQSRQIIYRWLRLVAQRDISRLDKRAKGTHEFIQSHIRELLVASVAGVGYDPRVPLDFETAAKLICKRETTFHHPRNPDLEVKIVNDEAEMGAFVKPDGRTVLHATYDRELKKCVLKHQGKVDVFEPVVKEGDPVGDPVDEFIRLHTQAALQREQEIFAGLQSLVANGELPEALRDSFEMGILFKLNGACDIARESDAEEGDGMDIEGKFSGNEIALFREALEFAGFSSRCSDLIMDIKRGADHEIQTASFNNMRAIYESAAHQRWRKGEVAKAWTKAYKPYASTKKLGARLLSVLGK